MMNLESLSNELLLDLFEFLSIVDLLRALHGLNARFNSLLVTHFRIYGHLDFRSVSKRNFDLLCQQHLPFVIDRIISLRLSNDDDTSQQIDLFFLHDFSLRQFTHLRLLSLYHTDWNEITMKMIDELHHLPYLTHLNFIEKSIRHEQTKYDKMINCIWSLPKLTHCHLDSRFKQLFLALRITSLSLEVLSVKNVNVDLNGLDHLFQHAHNLRYLRMCVIGSSVNQQLSSPIPSMITLKIVVRCSLNELMNILQNMPNLCQLTVETWWIHLNGQEWEQIITDYLPKLQIFQLKMNILLNLNGNKQQQVDQLMDSFCSSFWLEKHQWFIRCHWSSASRKNLLWLYTLPYAFVNFGTIINGTLSKSTCPKQNDHWSYNHVHDFTYESPIIEESISQIHFSNIHHLHLYVPYDNNFWSIIPTFDQLISLDLTLNDNNDHIRSQLQSLFDRAPRLYSLRILYWSGIQIPLIRNRSSSIRRLDLQGFDEYTDEHWFHDEKCSKLSRSPLGSRCEVLRIRITNRTDILDLINQMINLRTLNVQCRDDEWNGFADQSTLPNDKLLRWLEERLPSTWKILRQLDKSIQISMYQ